MQLRVARLTKAHGLKGGIKLELYTDEPDKRFIPGATFSLQVPNNSPWYGKTVTLKELRWYNMQPVAFFQEIADRTVAESIARAILLIQQDQKQLPADPDAWYDHQLVGLSVIREGVRVGEVKRVDHFPAQDLLVIGTEQGEVLLPFLRIFAPEIDIDRGLIVVTPPVGLFEDIQDDADGTPGAKSAPDAK